MPRSLTLSNDVRIAVARLSRRLRQTRADETVSFPHMSALGSLDKCGPLTLQDLSRVERVTPPSMLRTVNALVEHGYVARRPHESDGRKQLLEITSEGFAMMEATRRSRNLWLAERVDALSTEERALLAKAAPILERLAEA